MLAAARLLRTPEREKTRPDVVPLSDVDESLYDVVILFGGIALSRALILCQWEEFNQKVGGEREEYSKHGKNGLAPS